MPSEPVSSLYRLLVVLAALTVVAAVGCKTSTGPRQEVPAKVAGENAATPSQSAESSPPTEGEETGKLIGALFGSPTVTASAVSTPTSTPVPSTTSASPAPPTKLRLIQVAITGRTVGGNLPPNAYTVLGLPAAAGTPGEDAILVFTATTADGKDGVWMFESKLSDKLNSVLIGDPVKMFGDGDNSRTLSLGSFAPVPLSEPHLVAASLTTQDAKSSATVDGIYFAVLGEGKIIDLPVVTSEQKASGLKVDVEFSSFKDYLVNDDAAVLFRANTVGDGLWIIQSLFKTATPTTIPIIIEGDSIEGLEAGWNVSGSYPITPAGLNDSNDVLIYMEQIIKSVSDALHAVTTGIWINRDDRIRLVAMENSDAPGIVGEFFSFRQPTLNSSGQVAFAAEVNELSQYPGHITTIWKTDRSDKLVKVVQIGDKSPVKDLPIEFLSTPLIADDGNVLFVAWISGDEIQPCFGEQLVLKERSGDGFDVVARSNDLVASKEFGPCYSLGNEDGANISINSSGHIAFSWLFGEGIWAQDPSGKLIKIVETGDKIEVDSGEGPEIRTVTMVEFLGGTGSATGKASGFADTGDVTFKAIFEDGSEAIILGKFVLEDS